MSIGLSLELLGWLGGIFFAACALPQALQALRQGHSDGLSWGFLLLWLAGELLTLAYVLPKRDWPLLFNYGVNLAFLVVILRYKAAPRGPKPR